MPEGLDLIAEVEAREFGHGVCGLWWLGQNGFILKLGKAILYLDPFLSDLPGRQVRPLLASADVSNADFVLGSHDHGDHIDRPAWPDIARSSPGARFLVPDLLLPGLPDECSISRGRFLG